MTNGWSSETVWQMSVTPVAETAAADDRDLNERLSRVLADFENYRRHARAQVDAAAEAGVLRVVKSIVPVIDTLDAALVHSPDDGLRLVRQQMINALAQHGVEAVDPTGEVFDPRLHEAVTVRDGGKSGTVAETFRAGYSHGETVIRVAQVIVFS